MKQKVSLNILNYNTFEKSRVCIDSCLKQIDVEYQVLLIDNNSTDDSFERLRSIYGDRIKYLENKENYGFAKGNNIGVKYCEEQGIKYSFLLNSDIELIGERLVSNMVQIFESEKRTAVVAPLVYDLTSKGKLLHPNNSLYLKLLRSGIVIPKVKVITSELETVSEAHGSALMVDNSKFLKVGGFPEHYFMYGEESTFAKKILWGGSSIIWYKNQDCYVLHHHDKSGKVAPWRLYLMGRNRGLEYWENKRGHLLWPLVYGIFYFMMKMKKSNYYFYEGMRQAKSLYTEGHTKEELYKMAKEIIKVYK